MSSSAGSTTDSVNDREQSHSQNDECSSTPSRSYIRDLIRKNKEINEKIDALNAEIQKGIASGDGGILDMQKIKALAKSKVNGNT